jgi:hypothetical protein
VITWLRYVPHGQVLWHLAKGWTLSDDLMGTNHGAFSVLMVWAGKGEPG